MTTEKTYEALRTTTLFAGFTDEQLEMVPKVGRTRAFAAGESVIQVGDNTPTALWLVLEGSARVELEGRFIRSIGPGGHFGELALLSGEPRSADVLAETDMTVMEFTDRHLRGLIANDPAVAMSMLAELAQRLRSTTHEYAEYVRRHEHGVEVAGDMSGSIGDDAILGPIEYALKADGDR